MVSMTIRHVPDDARERLAARAERSGQSLQEFLLRLVVQEAERLDLEELLSAHRARLAASGSRASTESIIKSLHDIRGA